MITQQIEKIASSPKILFFIDGMGAGLTAFMLGLVLVRLEWFFGIPSTTLYFLAVIPLLFVIYDLYCYHRVGKKSSQYLRGIAIMNLMYCLLSLGFAFYHSGVITIWGWIYIINEIMIIIALVIFELKVANKLNLDPA